MRDENRDIEIRDDDLLAAYELGLLDDDAARRFEAATRKDASLLEELFDGAPAAAAMTADPARLVAVLRAVRAESQPSTYARLRGFFADLLTPRILASAMVTAAVILALVLVPTGEGKFAGLAVLEPLAYGQIDVRGDAPTADRLFHDAMDSYLVQNWDTAAVGLEQAIAAGAGDASWSRNDQAHLYLGSARLMAGRTGSAVTALQTAAVSPQPPVSERASWQLVQARLMLDDGHGALIELEGLLNSPVYGQRALELKKRLETP